MSEKIEYCEGAGGEGGTRDTEIAKLKATIALLIEKAEPFVKMADEAIDVLPKRYADDHMIGIECSWGAFHSLFLGDLRSLSEAIAKAREGI